MARKGRKPVLWLIWVVSLGVELVAVGAIVWGVKYEVVHQASTGNIAIAIGCGLAVFGAFIFAKVYTALLKKYN